MSEFMWSRTRLNICEILKIIKQNYVTNIKEKNDTGKIRCVIKYYVLMI